MKSCRYCGEEIVFKESRAYNLDGSIHSVSCARFNLFRRSRINCHGCETPLQRDAYEWQNGRIIDPDYRVLFCPSCQWFYDWRVSINGVGFGEVETEISRLDSDQRWKLYRHELEVAMPEHYQRALSVLPTELPF